MVHPALATSAGSCFPVDASIFACKQLPPPPPHITRRRSYRLGAEKSLPGSYDSTIVGRHHKCFLV
jgi:hypothetical protein